MSSSVLRAELTRTSFTLRKPGVIGSIRRPVFWRSSADRTSAPERLGAENLPTVSAQQRQPLCLAFEPAPSLGREPRRYPPPFALSRRGFRCLDAGSMRFRITALYRIFDRRRHGSPALTIRCERPLERWMGQPWGSIRCLERIFGTSKVFESFCRALPPSGAPVRVLVSVFKLQTSPRAPIARSPVRDAKPIRDFETLTGKSCPAYSSRPSLLPPEQGPPSSRNRP